MAENFEGDYEECHQKALADLANHPVPEVLNTAADAYRNHLKEAIESFRSLTSSDFSELK